MKRLVYLVSLLLLPVITAGLSGGTAAAVSGVKQRVLTIEIGEDRGVEKGMSGKVIGIAWDSASKKDVSFTMGDFIVRDVGLNSSKLSVKLYPNADPNWISSVEFDDDLGPVVPRIADLQGSIDKITRLMKNMAYTDAGPLIEQTEKQYPANKELVLLKAGLNLLLADKITVNDYTGFKKRKPPNFLLKDIKEKFCGKNKEPNLPPENYLDVNLPITKNEKGYYEITFPERNNHVMIYIPVRKIFTDKYEVSNAQAKQAGINVSSLAFSENELKKYPGACPNYPAIVDYNAAEKYCSTFGLRLPTEDEWEIAAGKEKGPYGWGHHGPDDTGIYRANYESMDDGYLELAPVDSFKPYCSPYGAVNMIGNVCEWVKEGYGKGGDFLSEGMDLEINDNKSTDSIYTGFRCVMEAEQ